MTNTIDSTPAAPDEAGAKVTWICRDETNGFFRVETSRDDALSPAAKHAYETFLYAFWLPGQTMTMGELRDALRKLYGEAVDRELEQHFHDRREAVLPNTADQRRSPE